MMSATLLEAATAVVNERKIMLIYIFILSLLMFGNVLIRTFRSFLGLDEWEKVMGLFFLSSAISSGSILLYQFLG